MTTNRSAVTFEHREVAIVFAIFVFVALLMFTTGLVVGKGLSMAKYEGKVPVDVTHFEAQLGEFGGQQLAGSTIGAGTSVNTGSLGREPAAEDNSLALPKRTESFEPMPKKVESDLYGTSLLEPDIDDKEMKSLLENPDIKSLLEDAPIDRKPAAKKSGLPAIDKVPFSAAIGNYIVQVASYPAKAEADSRVDQLKKMGFENAYSAQVEFPNKETYYRVLLGYYSNYDQAKKNGEFLKKSGDIKKYIIRNADTTG